MTRVSEAAAGAATSPTFTHCTATARVHCTEMLHCTAVQRPYTQLQYSFVRPTRHCGPRLITGVALDVLTEY